MMYVLSSSVAAADGNSGSTIHTRVHVFNKIRRLACVTESEVVHRDTWLVVTDLILKIKIVLQHGNEHRKCNNEIIFQQSNKTRMEN